MKVRDQPEVAEERQSLWLLTASPSIWGAHFLVSYAIGALWCGKVVDRGGELRPAQLAIIGLAVVALAGVAVVGWRGWRKHQYGDVDPPYDRDTPEDRHRFLGFATVLLSGLSAVAIIYVALSSLFVSNCW
jgi:hypothetical protein